MKLKSLLLMSFVVGAIVILSLSGAFAELNKSKGKNESRIVGSNIDEKNAGKNMTFGKCVSESAKAQKLCYIQTKEQLKSCSQVAKNQTDSATKKTARKQCTADYKASLKTCKADFKSAKKECQKIKHNFFDEITAAL